MYKETNMSRPEIQKPTELLVQVKLSLIGNRIIPIFIYNLKIRLPIILKLPRIKNNKYFFEYLYNIIYLYINHFSYLCFNFE